MLIGRGASAPLLKPCYMSLSETVRVQEHIKNLNTLMSPDYRGNCGRIVRYGRYWNAISTVDMRKRSHTVNAAYEEITSALKDARLLMLDAHSMPSAGWDKRELARQELRLAHVNLRLDWAWDLMTGGPLTGESCMPN